MALSRLFASKVAGMRTNGGGWYGARQPGHDEYDTRDLIAPPDFAEDVCSILPYIENCGIASMHLLADGRWEVAVGRLDARLSVIDTLPRAMCIALLLNKFIGEK
jgi:hypothetical protein